MMSISEKNQYHLSKWKDHGKFWLYDVDQKDLDWILVRKGRPSGSNCGYLLGHGNKSFGSKNDTLLEIAGKKEKVFTDQQLDNMKFGETIEPLAREWYAETRKVKVKELGFVVPKWNYELGVSVDGVILVKNGVTGEYEEGDGMIEIKGPKKMYYPLSQHIEKQEKGYSNLNDFSHIWTTHYDQMQLGMAILGKKWCDYVVYCQPENKAFVERIPFDEKYWVESMYEPLKEIIKNELRPLLEGSPYPLMPPSC